MKSCLKCTTETCPVACISFVGEEGAPGRCPRGFWWLENQGKMHTLTPYHLCPQSAAPLGKKTSCYSSNHYFFFFSLYIGWGRKTPGASQAGISMQSRNMQICFFLPTIFVQTAEDLSLLSFHFVSCHEGCTDTCSLKNGFILPSGLGAAVLAECRTWPFLAHLSCVVLHCQFCWCVGMASAPETISDEALQGRFLARCCPLVSKRCLGTKLPFLEPFFGRSGRAWDSPWWSGLCVCLLYKQGRRRMSSIRCFLPLQPSKSPKNITNISQKMCGEKPKG